MSEPAHKVILLCYPGAHESRQGLFIPTGSEAELILNFLDELVSIGCPLDEVLTVVLTSPQPVCVQIAKILAGTLETKAYIINSLTSRLENPADLRYCGLGHPESYFGELNRLLLASPRVNIKHMNDLEAIVEDFPEPPASVFNRLQATLQLYFTTIQDEFRAYIDSLRARGVRPLHEVHSANPVVVVVTHLEAVQATADQLRLPVQESRGFRYVQASYDSTAYAFVRPGCALVGANIWNLGRDDDLIEVQRGVFEVFAEFHSHALSMTDKQADVDADRHQANIKELDDYLKEASRQYDDLFVLRQAVLDLGQEMLKSSSSS
jgi:hypothetical protein